MSSSSSSSKLMEYHGSCHCGLVSFSCFAPFKLVAWDCNCSNCYKRRNIHFIIPKSQFHLKGSSHDHLTNYQFGTEVAEHLFCSNCGITSFYSPRWFFLSDLSLFLSTIYELLLFSFLSNSHYFLYIRSNPDGVGVSLYCLDSENEIEDDQTTKSDNNQEKGQDMINTSSSKEEEDQEDQQLHKSDHLFLPSNRYSIEKFDGQNWEQFFEQSNISTFSKIEFEDDNDSSKINVNDNKGGGNSNDDLLQEESTNRSNIDKWTISN